MRTALDTNVVSGLWNESTAGAEISRMLRDAQAAGGLVVCGIVYAELLARPRGTQALTDQFLSEMGIEIDFRLADAGWIEAGLRFGGYAVRRRRSAGEAPRRLLADFLIGAHALHQADRLMTFDARYYRQDFPELRLYPATL